MGSVRQFTNSAGTVTESYQYDASGSQITDTAGSFAAVATGVSPPDRADRPLI